MHEGVIDVVEADGIARAALASNFEVDRVVDIPVRLFGDAIPADLPRLTGLHTTGGSGQSTLLIHAHTVV